MAWLCTIQARPVPLPFRLVSLELAATARRLLRLRPARPRGAYLASRGQATWDSAVHWAMRAAFALARAAAIRCPVQRGPPRERSCLPVVRAVGLQLRSKADLSHHGNVLGGEGMAEDSPQRACFEGWHAALQMSMAGNQKEAMKQFGHHVADGCIFVGAHHPFCKTRGACLCAVQGRIRGMRICSLSCVRFGCVRYCHPPCATHWSFDTAARHRDTTHPHRRSDRQPTSRRGWVKRNS